jgi:hypothetical protein
MLGAVLNTRTASTTRRPGKAPLLRRPVVLFGLAAGLILILAVTVSVFVSREPSAAPDARPPVETQLGVFRGTDPAQVKGFEAWLGRDVDYAVDFSARATWADIAAPQYLLDAWQGTPYRQVYSAPLLPEDPADTIERGASGEYDDYFAELARRLVESGHQDAIIRLGWEFNLPDSRWATSNSAAFIAYWRRVVAAMRAQPGQEFQFDWNPNNGDGQHDAVDYYPGNDVVDYIGVDAYDTSWASDTYPYPADCDPACRAQRQRQAWDESVFGGARGLKFWSAFAAKQGKPMSLPEWGLWQRADGHGGGEDLDYLRRMKAFIADPRNRVAYQAYFEVDGDDGSHRLMTTYPQAGTLFRTLFGARPGSAG